MWGLDEPIRVRHPSTDMTSVQGSKNKIRANGLEDFCWYKKTVIPKKKVFATRTLQVVTVRTQSFIETDCKGKAAESITSKSTHTHDTRKLLDY